MSRALQALKKGKVIRMTVKEVIKIKEIEKILNMFEKCLNYYQYYENIYNFIYSLKEFYIKNNYLTNPQMKWLNKYYDKINEDWENMIDECNSYSLEDGYFD